MQMNRVIRLGIGLGLAIGAAVCLGQASQAPESQRQTALALEQQGKNVEAEAAWRVFLKAHPSNPEPYAHLGLLEARQEHYKEAVPLYRKALAMNPAIPGLRMNLGLALFKGGDLKQAAAHDPQNLPLRLALAHSCMWSKQYQCVLDTYHEILMLNAESAEADMLAGEALDEMKDHGGAIQQFRDAVKADPREPDVHFGLGYLLWTQRQYPEAASEFQAELANDPDHIQAMIYLGDTQIRLKHPEEARPLLEKALRVDVGRELAHLDLGILYADSGRYDDALREMMEAARLAPEDVNVHWRLGRLYRSMGRKDEAKAEFDKASSITKAADDAVVNKMDGAHAKGRPAQQPAAEPEK